MNVWTCWEGPRPKFIDLCLRSAAKACSGDDFRLVTPKNLQDYVPFGTIHPNYQRLPLAIKSCCIRAALLAEYGGWWWDADTIGLKTPRALTESYPKASALYTVWDREPRRVLNGYVHLTGLLATRWLDQINRALADSFDSIKWCSLGEGILTRMLTDDFRAVQVPRRLFLPIDIDSNVEEFFLSGNPQDRIDSSTVAFGLNHSYFMYHRSAVMDPPWSSNLLIHRLLKMAEATI